MFRLGNKGLYESFRMAEIAEEINGVMVARKNKAQPQR